MAYHDRRTLALVAVLALVACGTPTGKAPRASEPTPARKLIELEATRLVYTDPQGRLRWELKARGLSVDRTDQVSASSPQGHLVAEDGTQVQVRADEAVYLRGSGTVQLSGRVTVRAATDRWMSAEKVLYEPQRDRLLASGRVRMRVGEWMVQAHHLEAEPGLRRARFQGSVRLWRGEATL